MNQQQVSQVYTSPSRKEQVEFLFALMQRHCHVTRGHLERASAYAVALGQRLLLEPRDLETLRVGALLHDIGKLLVPQAILIKPERLTADEFLQVQRHPQAGAECCAELHWLHDALPIIHHHHDQWDGNGYPAGLHAYDIPIGARICAVVDAYDACRADRYYRKGMSRREAVQVLIDGKGKYYDPMIVNAFLSYLKEPGIDRIDKVLPLQPYTDNVFQAAFYSEAVQPQRGLLES